MFRGSGIVAFLALAICAAGWAKDPRQELLDTDREFDNVTSREGASGWVSYFAEDGVMMPAGGEIIVGRENIRAYVEKNMFAPNVVLRWEPIEAYASGGLGYTYGLYKLSRVEAPGKTASFYGKYTTVWKKVRGRWLVALDIGNASPAPPKK